MSNYYDFDSINRDRTVQNQNENQYTLSIPNTSSWLNRPRAVTNISTNPQVRPTSFVWSIRVLSLVVPYNAYNSQQPKLYVKIRSSNSMSQRNFVNSINNVHSDAFFVCYFDKVQTDSTDTRRWIHFKSDVDQVYNIDFKQYVQIEISDRFGNVLPQTDAPYTEDPDPFQQTLILTQATPYLRDADYANHASQPKISYN